MYNSINLMRRMLTKHTRIRSSICNQLRELNLHEYQSKKLFEDHNIPIQEGQVCNNLNEVKTLASSYLSQIDEIVLKAQIHAGGRGKGYFEPSGLKGGVQILDSMDGIDDIVNGMLNNSLITKQTTSNGQIVNQILVCKSVNIIKETYLAILLDRSYDGPVLVACEDGGMDIEEISEKTPEKILKIPIDIMHGITHVHTDRIIEFLNFDDMMINNNNNSSNEKKITKTSDLHKHISTAINNLYDLFIKTDCTQIEINPYAMIDTNEVLMIDAKLNFDDNAMYRQKDLFALRDITMEDPRDLRAEEADLNYIGLEGNIGCMVNGAGLAMATMDIIEKYGGKPDVGGGATKEQVAEAFRILVSDKNVETILVNIFGGIMKCDIIAEGIVEAYKEVQLDIPIIVRLEGTNVGIGKSIIEDSGLPFITADDLDDAGMKAINIVEDK